MKKALLSAALVALACSAQAVTIDDLCGFYYGQLDDSYYLGYDWTWEFWGGTETSFMITKYSDTQIAMQDFYWNQPGAEFIGTVDLENKTITFEPQTVTLCGYEMWFYHDGYNNDIPDYAVTFLNLDYVDPVVATFDDNGNFEFSDAALGWDVSGYGWGDSYELYWLESSYLKLGVKATKYDMYAIGSMNEWKINPDYKFTFDADSDLYVYSAASLKGEMKITCADYTGEARWDYIDYGGGFDLAEGGYSLVWQGANMNANLEDVTLSLDLNVLTDDGYPTMILSVEGKSVEPDPIVIGDLYLVGAASGWAIDPAYKFTLADGVYTFTGTDIAGEWKVAGEPLWTGVNLGTAEAANVGDGETVELVNNGQNLTFTADGEVTLTVTVAEDGMSGTLTLEKKPEESGVGSIAADSSDVQWFNLQGVRVENPEQGLFIRVAGAKAEKVVVK